MPRLWTVFFLWLATGLVALGTVAPLFVHTFYFLTAIILASYFWSWSGVRGLEIHRRLVQPRAQVGQYIEERFLLRNRSYLPKLWLEIRDVTQLPVHRVDRVLSAIAPRHERGWSVRTRVLRRGRFRLGPIQVSSGDPFGLFGHQRILESYASVTVYPYLFEIPSLPPPSGQLSGGHEVQVGPAQITTNVMGVREYAPGDSVSRIHWKSTAHHDRLMVKEFEIDPQVQVWLFLDLNRRFQRRSEDLHPESPDPLFERPEPILNLLDSTEEYAVSVVGSVARHLARRGQSVGLVTHAPTRMVIQPDRGDRQVLRLLDALAVVRAGSAYPFARVLAEEGAQLPRAASVVAVTSSWETEWVAGLKVLQGRGLRCSAIVLEASTFGPAESTLRVLGNLAAAGIPGVTVGRGQDLGQALLAGWWEHAAGRHRSQRGGGAWLKSRNAT